MKRSFVCFCVAVGSLSGLLFPVSLGAQSQSAVYVGELSGSRSGCNSLNGAITEVTVQGDEIKGSRANSRGTKERFEGKLKGSTFSISQKDNRGNESVITGTIEADKIDFRIEQTKCTYRATLKKQ